MTMKAVLQAEFPKHFLAGFQGFDCDDIRISGVGGWHSRVWSTAIGEGLMV